jgi:hypothetical protein
MANLKNTYMEINSPKVFIVGQLTRELPFLTKSKNQTFMVPFLYQENDQDTMLNIADALELKTQKENGVSKIVTVERKIIKPTSYEKRKRKFLSVATNLPKETKYVPLFAAGDIAMDIYLNYKKGDTVTLIGHIVQMNIPGFEKPEEMLWIEDIRKIRSSLATIQSNAISADNI